MSTEFALSYLGSGQQEESDPTTCGIIIVRKAILRLGPTPGNKI